MVFAVISSEKHQNSRNCVQQQRKSEKKKKWLKYEAVRLFHLPHHHHFKTFFALIVSEQNV